MVPVISNIVKPVIDSKRYKKTTSQVVRKTHISLPPVLPNTREGAGPSPAKAALARGGGGWAAKYARVKIAIHIDKLNLICDMNREMYLASTI